MKKGVLLRLALGVCCFGISAGAMALEKQGVSSDVEVGAVNEVKRAQKGGMNYQIIGGFQQQDIKNYTSRAGEEGDAHIDAFSGVHLALGMEKDLGKQFATTMLPGLSHMTLADNDGEERSMTALKYDQQFHYKIDAGSGTEVRPLMLVGVGWSDFGMKNQQDRLRVEADIYSYMFEAGIGLEMKFNQKFLFSIKEIYSYDKTFKYNAKLVAHDQILDKVSGKPALASYNSLSTLFAFGYQF
ncbi:MAG: hypothetical protein HQK50_06175 [Oligoflexia bacterium]|nr:hypothetical protein [Oligoflexia bacterium]MBF0365138.1 hypothetical protein [Oligoflexia bacterium]